MQRDDFYGVFKAMHGTPVTIRTIDPPLHEFLPKREDLMVEIAAWRRRARRARSSTRRRRCSRRVEQLHEFNPMLGHRGVRLGITYPEITEMQTRAIMEAACQLTKEGVKVVPEIMIPLVGDVRELKRSEGDRRSRRRRGDEGAGRQGQVPGRHDDRGAARRADRRRDRAEAQFFSFGTNDLTQLTFGFSRDDIGKFLRRLSGARRSSSKDPFATHRHRRRRPARRDGRRRRAAPRSRT